MKYVEYFSDHLSEKLVYNRILNPKFWQNGKFDPEIRTKLLQIANDFYTDLKVDSPMVDVQLTGSMANYMWSEHSDLDVHVHINFEDIDDNVDLVKKAIDGQRFVWNLRHPVFIKGHDVELYMQDSSEPHFASGIYSLMKDEWVIEPKWDPPTVDMEYVAKRVDAFKEEIAEIERMLKDPELDSDDARFVADRVSVLKQKIMKARAIGLERDGEFSVENLVFKELRHSGWIEKLVNAGSKSYSEIYSDDEVANEPSIEKTNKEIVSESYVDEFDIFMDEALSPEQRAEYIEKFDTIQQMIDSGMLDQREIPAMRRELMRKAGGTTPTMTDPELQTIIRPHLYTAMQSPEYQALLTDGWYSTSTNILLYNGTIALSTSHASGSATSQPISIAVFASRYIRRIWGSVPKVMVNNVPGDGPQMYINAFKWIRANLDPTTANLRSLPKRRRLPDDSGIRRYGQYE